MPTVLEQTYCLTAAQVVRFSYDGFLARAGKKRFLRFRNPAYCFAGNEGEMVAYLGCWLIERHGHRWYISLGDPAERGNGIDWRGPDISAWPVPVGVSRREVVSSRRAAIQIEAREGSFYRRALVRSIGDRLSCHDWKNGATPYSGLMVTHGGYLGFDDLSRDLAWDTERGLVACGPTHKTRYSPASIYAVARAVALTLSRVSLESFNR